LKAFEDIFNKILSLLSKEELSNLQLGFDVMVKFSRVLNKYKMSDRGDQLWS